MGYRLNPDSKLVLHIDGMEPIEFNSTARVDVRTSRHRPDKVFINGEELKHVKSITMENAQPVETIRRRQQRTREAIVQDFADEFIATAMAVPQSMVDWHHKQLADSFLNSAAKGWVRRIQTDTILETEPTGDGDAPGATLYLSKLPSPQLHSEVASYFSGVQSAELVVVAPAMSFVCDSLWDWQQRIHDWPAICTAPSFVTLLDDNLPIGTPDPSFTTSLDWEPPPELAEALKDVEYPSPCSDCDSCSSPDGHTCCEKPQCQDPCPTARALGADSCTGSGDPGYCQQHQRKLRQP
jgi:hypothetical protein